MWFIGVEVEQETSAPPPKKNPGSAPDIASKALVVALKKKTEDFLPLFQTFSRFGKFLGKFQDFFKDSRLCTNRVVRRQQRNCCLKFYCPPDFIL